MNIGHLQCLPYVILCLNIIISRSSYAIHC
nr:MAG TPA: hypothetical protein [Caudoviricetes sp.]